MPVGRLERDPAADQPDEHRGLHDALPPAEEPVRSRAGTTRDIHGFQPAAEPMPAAQYSDAAPNTIGVAGPPASASTTSGTSASAWTTTQGRDPAAQARHARDRARRGELEHAADQQRQRRDEPGEHRPDAERERERGQVDLAEPGHEAVARAVAEAEPEVAADPAGSSHATHVAPRDARAQRAASRRGGR